MFTGARRLLSHGEARLHQYCPSIAVGVLEQAYVGAVPVAALYQGRGEAVRGQREG